MVTSAQIDSREAFTLGEVRVSFEGGTAVLAGPEGIGEASEIDGTPRSVRERVRADDRGRYRPLAGARSLPHSWHARCRTSELPALLDEVYPVALRHSDQYERGTLRVVGLADVLARQTGRYSVAAELDDAGREAASAVLCGLCVKTPLWREPQVAPEHIPCPEPCSVLVSLCREAALWQREPPAPTVPDQEIAFAAFDEPGNEVREAYLDARYGHG